MRGRRQSPSSGAGQLDESMLLVPWSSEERDNMTESKFLGGKVHTWSLPVVEEATGDYSLKRLLLPQGELARIYDAEQGVRYIAFIELRAGTVRGNHVHRVKEEFLYVIRGELTLVVEDIASRAGDMVPLRTGDLAFIAAGIAHALQTTASGQAIEFSTARFDPADSYRFPLG